MIDKDFIHKNIKGIIKSLAFNKIINKEGRAISTFDIENFVNAVSNLKNHKKYHLWYSNLYPTVVMLTFDDLTIQITEEDISTFKYESRKKKLKKIIK